MQLKKNIERERNQIFQDGKAKGKNRRKNRRKRKNCKNTKRIPYT